MGDLPSAGVVVAEKRGRGRPLGSKNKNKLGGLVVARYGGSAVDQAARLCMVTPAELKAAGGDHLEAMARKAEALKARLRLETLGEAWKMLQAERQALMPYTDKKQPMAVDVTTDQPPATFVLVPSGPGLGAAAPVLDLGASEWSEPQSLPLNDMAEGQVTPAKSPGEA